MPYPWEEHPFPRWAVDSPACRLSVIWECGSHHAGWGLGGRRAWGARLWGQGRFGEQGSPCPSHAQCRVSTASFLAEIACQRGVMVLGDIVFFPVWQCLPTTFWSPWPCFGPCPWELEYQSLGTLGL